MTSPAEPTSGDPTPASQVTKPLRELAALVLLAANAVLLFVGLLRLLVPTDDYSTFTGRAGGSFFSFAGVESAVLPVLAVLLATHVRPVLPKARLITQAALGEYALGAGFGVLTLLIWLVGRLTEGAVLDAFLGLLTRVAWLAILGVAALVVFRLWSSLYHTPKPRPQPGVYGQPQPGWPQQPAPGQGGYPSAVPPQQPGGYPAPGQYGQPQPPFNAAPPHAPQSTPPFSAPQAGSHFGVPHAGPSYGVPHPAPPFGQPPSVEPTQAIPRQPGEPGPSVPPDGDRTQRFDRDDPNFPR